jgi:glyoxylase-like metal-dependent hydrolase (beta-lactamase superfamily II)
MKIFSGLHAFLWANPTANNCNTYLLQGGKNVLVDPGHFHLLGHVRDELSRLSLSVKDLDLALFTHGHPDHLEGIRIFSGTDTLTAVSAREMKFIHEAALHYGEIVGVTDAEPDILLHEGELKAGSLSLEVIHTPGHSPGSICLYWPFQKALFTGDLLFYQGVGRVDLPGGNGEELKESIRKIAELDIEHLLPGHGEPISGSSRVRANFEAVEQYWFAYL